MFHYTGLQPESKNEMYIFKLLLKSNEIFFSLSPYTLFSEMEKMYLFELKAHQINNNTTLNTLAQKHTQHMNLFLTLSTNNM